MHLPANSELSLGPLWVMRNLTFVLHIHCVLIFTTYSSDLHLVVSETYFLWNSSLFTSLEALVSEDIPKRNVKCFETSSMIKQIQIPIHLCHHGYWGWGGKKMSHVKVVLVERLRKFLHSNIPLLSHETPWSCHSCSVFLIVGSTSNNKLQSATVNLA